MDQSFNTFLQLNKKTEIRNVSDFARNPCAGFVLLRDFIPWIGGQMFDAERKMLILFINAKDHRSYVVALLVKL